MRDAPDGVSILYDFFIVFCFSSSSRRLHRLSANLTARAYISVVQLTVFVMTLAIFIACQLAALPACVFLPPYRLLPVSPGYGQTSVNANLV